MLKSIVASFLGSLTAIALAFGVIMSSPPVVSKSQPSMPTSSYEYDSVTSQSGTYMQRCHSAGNAAKLVGERKYNIAAMWTRSDGVTVASLYLMDGDFDSFCVEVDESLPKTATVDDGKLVLHK